MSEYCKNCKELADQLEEANAKLKSAKQSIHDNQRNAVEWEIKFLESNAKLSALQEQKMNGELVPLDVVVDYYKKVHFVGAASLKQFAAEMAKSQSS